MFFFLVILAVDLVTFIINFPSGLMEVFLLFFLSRKKNPLNKSLVR